MRTSLLALSLLTLAYLNHPACVLAYAEGISGYSGNPATLGEGAICSACHNIYRPSTVAPLVSFEGPRTVVAGTIASFQFIVQSQAPATQVAAGLDVSADGGEIGTVDGQMEMLLDGELTHAPPPHGQLGGTLNDANGIASWEFTWRAPATVGSYTLYGAGNSTNRSGSIIGDEAASATFTVRVIGSEVTPGSTATATPTSAATHTTTATPIAPVCGGDCNGNGDVTIDEVVTLVRLALEGGDLSICRAGDLDGSGDISVTDIVSAVNAALNGC